MSKESRTIQEKLADLNEMVAWFDSEQFDLEQALVRFKEAEILSAEIEADLGELKNEVSILKQKFTEGS